MDGRCYPVWVLSAVRRGKQRQFVCWIQVRTTDGKVKLAKCLIDSDSEVNLVRRGFLQEDEAKMSSTPVQLEGVSGHCLEGGNREAELAVRLVKQSVLSVETVTEEWFSGKFYEATIKYDLFLGQPWLHAHRVLPIYGTQNMLPPGSFDQRPVRPVLSAPIHQECTPIQGAK